MPTLLNATVKQVLSGDTLIVKGRAVNGPPPERLLTLSCCSAPRFQGRGEQVDEPHAFESREWLRKLAVGKQIQFAIDYVIPGGREFASVTLQDGQQLSEMAISSGMCRHRAGLNMQEDQTFKLQSLEKEAQEAGLGLWSDCSVQRVINYNLDDVGLFFKQGATVPAVVEQVINGSALRVLLLNDMQIVTVQISGISAPRSGQNAEPFGDECKYFAECRILQREVGLKMESTNGKNIIGSIVHPAGSIAELLLKSGLAKINDYTLNAAADSNQQLRQAEQFAKDQKLKLWSNFQPNISASQQYEGQVIKIQGPDCIIITVDNQEQKLYLASYRQPNLKDERESFYHQEAREFIRRKLIGKQVRAKVDYIRSGQEGYEDRKMATILFGGKNVAELLIARGLGTVMKHRNDDHDRSSQMDALLSAEESAKNSHKGLWSDKPVSLPRIVDASENVSRARSFLSQFQRAGKMQAVVEYVANAGRFRLLLPKESIKMSFVLSGIKAPRLGKADATSEPFAKEAYDFTQSRTFQRDVEIEIENVDKTGSFVGHLLFDGSSLAVQLLQQGLASVHAGSATHSSQGNALFAAENLARNAKLGMWSLEAPVELQSDEIFEPQLVSVKIISTSLAGILVGIEGQPGEILAQLAFIRLPPIGNEYADEALGELQEFLKPEDIVKARVEYSRGPAKFLTFSTDSISVKDALSVNGQMLSIGLAEMNVPDKYQNRAKLLLECHLDAKRNRYGMYLYGDYSLTEENFQ